MCSKIHPKPVQQFVEVNIDIVHRYFFEIDMIRTFLWESTDVILGHFSMIVHQGKISENSVPKSAQRVAQNCSQNVDHNLIKNLFNEIF